MLRNLLSWQIRQGRTLSAREIVPVSGPARLSALSLIPPTPVSAGTSTSLHLIHLFLHHHIILHLVSSSSTAERISQDQPNANAHAEYGHGSVHNGQEGSVDQTK